MGRYYINEIDIIKELDKQIRALLDLMQCCDGDCIDVSSIQMASEMCITMLDEMDIEFNKIIADIQERNTKEAADKKISDMIGW